MTQTVTFRDWAYFDDTQEWRDTPQALRGDWQAVFKSDLCGLHLDLKAPDGTNRYVWVEIEEGDLVVRVYADDDVSDEMAGELRLKPGQAIAEAKFGE